MRKVFLLMLIIVSAFAGSVSGTLTQIPDFFPIPIPMPGITVRLENTTDPTDYVEVVTGSAGEFTISTASTGFFHLHCPDLMTTPSLHSVTFTTGSETYTGYDFVADTSPSTDGALVGGKVSYEDGTPADGISVIINRPDVPITFPLMLTTNLSGEFSASIDGDENIAVTCMAMLPYTASPPIHEAFIASGDTSMSFDFILVGDSPIPYQLSFSGGLEYEFTAYYSHSSDSVEHSMFITMDTPPITVPDSGDYYCRAEKPGFAVSPPSQVVHIGGLMPIGMAVFTFTDTSTSSDYLITCNAVDGFMPIMDYTIRWREEGETAWITEAPSLFGTVNIVPDGPGIFEITALSPGLLLMPELAIVELTVASPTDSVTFSAEDTTTGESWFTVHVTDEEGFGVMDVEIYYEASLDPETSGILTTDSEGYATYPVELLGSFDITPMPETGFWTVPETDNVLISPLSPVDTVHFELREGEVFYYNVTVSARDSEYDLMTSSYVIQYRTPSDTAWATQLSGGSGYTDFTFEDPGAYDFQTIAWGYESEPSILTAMLSEEYPLDSLEFTMIDSTAPAEPFLMTIRSFNADGEPFADLPVAWDRSLSEEGDTISTGTTGVVTLEFETTAYYNFEAMPEAGFFTDPLTDSRLLSVVNPVDTVDFIVHEGSAGSYIATIFAIDEDYDIITSYTIEWREASEDSSWTMLWASEEYTDITFDYPAELEIRASMYGLMFEPEIAHASLSEESPYDTVMFTMTDTSGITDDFSITILSQDEDEFPYGYLEVSIESALDTTEYIVATDGSGVVTEYFSASGYYTLTPIAPDGYYVTPESYNSLLSMFNPADTVVFEVIEGEPPSPYWITIFATDSSESPSFGVSMDIEDDNATTDFGGYATIFVEGPGVYEVSAYITEFPGFEFVVVPGEFDVTLTETHIADTTHVWVTNVSSVEENPNVPNEVMLSVYPNPFNGTCFIDAPDGADVQIFDVNGKLSGKNIGSFIWNPENLPSGLYNVKIIGSDRSENLLYIK